MIAGKFREIIDDGYIHWNLLRHMLKAGLMRMAQNLVTDLRWLAAKLSVTEPADLLNDYLSIKGHVDKKVLYSCVMLLRLTIREHILFVSLLSGCCAISGFGCHLGLADHSP